MTYLIKYKYLMICKTKYSFL